jgi:hypothetical protein
LEQRVDFLLNFKRKSTCSESFWGRARVKTKISRNVLILIGVVIAAGYGLEGPSSSSDKESTGKRLEFRIISMADFVDEEATEAGFRTGPRDTDTHFGLTRFFASDGVTLDSEGGPFRSPEEAKRYFDWKLARCYKILKHGIETDSKGKAIGYRAEVVLARDQDEPVVMWTDGADFRQVIARFLPKGLPKSGRAQALADARELEKRYTHQSR